MVADSLDRLDLGDSNDFRGTRAVETSAYYEVRPSQSLLPMEAAGACPPTYQSHWY